MANQPKKRPATPAASDAVDKRKNLKVKKDSLRDLATGARQQRNVKGGGRSTSY